MSIKKLPDYVVNTLKAGEIVERPYAIIKELVENSLDAGAQHVSINVFDWWKKRIIVEDDWSGIEISDMDMVLERYATSKITDTNDLQSLSSYGFRWEALASIAEVTSTTILSKTKHSQLGIQLYKHDTHLKTKPMATQFDHGTRVIVQDLFYNVPARQKFLKGSQTEYFYCYNYMQDIGLARFDVYFQFLKNDTVIYDLPAVDTLKERITQLYKKDWWDHLHELSHTDDVLSITGVVGDAWLRFGTPDHIKIFVNKRPVNDRVVKKALLDAYRRQIIPGEYPLAILFIDIDPSKVDVNVHPRKLEVKFLDSQHVFQTVHHLVQGVLWWHKVTQESFSWWARNNGSSFFSWKQSSLSSQRPSQQQDTMFTDVVLSQVVNDTSEQGDTRYHHDQIGEYTLVWQLWNMYIVLESIDGMYLIDQHALAERIAFEKLRVAAKKEWLVGQPLLHPLSLDISQRAAIDEKIEQLWSLWFDVSLLSDTRLAVYAVPRVLVAYKVDIEELLESILDQDTITLDLLLDEKFAMKACKASIKAWQKLSSLQMMQLVKDGFSSIDWMFVCQHGRPFFVKIDKKQIDGMMDR